MEIFEVAGVFRLLVLVRAMMEVASLSLGESPCHVMRPRQKACPSSVLCLSGVNLGVSGSAETAKPQTPTSRHSQDIPVSARTCRRHVGDMSPILILLWLSCHIVANSSTCRRICHDVGSGGDPARTSPILLGHHLGHCHDVELNEIFERNSMSWQVLAVS